MFRLFNGSSLESILSSFEKTAVKLASHIEKKADETFHLEGLKADIEHDISLVKEEAARAERVLVKVKDLVS